MAWEDDGWGVEFGSFLCFLDGFGDSDGGSEVEEEADALRATCLSRWTACGIGEAPLSFLLHNPFYTSRSGLGQGLQPLLLGGGFGGITRAFGQHWCRALPYTWAKARKKHRFSFYPCLCLAGVFLYLCLFCLQCWHRRRLKAGVYYTPHIC